MVGIYRITNLVNGKSYIGQSVNIRKRLNRHKSAAFNKRAKNYNYPLYCAIRKYGIENFTFEPIEECLKSDLNRKEIFYIEKYDTLKNGYNQVDGGTHVVHATKLSPEQVSAIIRQLKTSVATSEEIGKAFGVSGRTIRGINSGEFWRSDTEAYPIRPALSKLYFDTTLDEYGLKFKYCKLCGKIIATSTANYCIACGHKSERKVERPDPLDLAKMILDSSFRAVGRRYSVSDNTIKKWCKYYNMPHIKKDLQVWYINMVGPK